MLRYIFKRALSLSLSLVVASLVIFFLIEVIPGDTASFMLGLNATEEAVANLRADLGLDGTALQRYLSWTGGMLQGDALGYPIPTACQYPS